MVAPDGDWLIPVVRGISFDSPEEAEAYLLADNKLTTLGGWDDSMLNDMIQDAIAPGGVGLVGTGFSQEEIDALVESVMGDHNAEPPEDFDEYGEDIDVDFKCPKCGHAWSGRSS